MMLYITSVLVIAGVPNANGMVYTEEALKQLVVKLNAFGDTRYSMDHDGRLVFKTTDKAV